MSKRARADLNDVQFFLDAVQAGSFSAAARLLDVPPSTVSRRVARLETELGVRLLQRTSRALQLTEAGRTYAASADRALGELATAQQALGDLQDAPRGRVRISLPAGMGSVVWTVLERFLTEYPEVRVDLDLSDRFVDLVAEGFDMAIRSHPIVGATLVGRRLATGARQLFASPQYLDARGHPRTAKALADHDCILVGARGERATWTLYSGSSPQRVKVRARIVVNEARMAVRCAASGFGIVLMSRSLAEPYLREGRLSRVLPRLTGGETGLWLVYADRRLPAAARALADVLARELPSRFP